MTATYIPDDIAQFIVDKIESVAEIEALLLCRSNAQEQWSLDALAKRLYIGAEQTAQALARLCAAGFLIATETEPRYYRYEPISQELRQMVDRVAEAYSKHLVAVTNLIHSKPKTRVQEFADAFRIRKDK